MGITQILQTAIQMYIYVIFAFVIMSWLLSFNIISLRTKIWSQIWGVLTSLTNPIFTPLRQMLPPFNGIDFTPIVVLFVLSLVRNML